MGYANQSSPQLGIRDLANENSLDVTVTGDSTPHPVPRTRSPPEHQHQHRHADQSIDPSNQLTHPAAESSARSDFDNTSLPNIHLAKPAPFDPFTMILRIPHTALLITNTSTTTTTSTRARMPHLHEEVAARECHDPGRRERRFEGDAGTRAGCECASLREVSYVG